eukprot:8773886-Alexandrium_andersonii.AAC.1
MEVFSPPRVTAMAERRPRYGVLRAGALDLRPGPGGAVVELRPAQRPREGNLSQAVPADWQSAMRLSLIHI